MVTSLESKLLSIEEERGNELHCNAGLSALKTVNSANKTGINRTGNSDQASVLESLAVDSQSGEGRPSTARTRGHSTSSGWSLPTPTTTGSIPRTRLQSSPLCNSTSNTEGKLYLGAFLAIRWTLAAVFTTIGAAVDVHQRHVVPRWPTTQEDTSQSDKNT